MDRNLREHYWPMGPFWQRHISLDIHFWGEPDPHCQWFSLILTDFLFPVINQLFLRHVLYSLYGVLETPLDGPKYPSKCKAFSPKGRPDHVCLETL